MRDPASEGDTLKLGSHGTDSTPGAVGEAHGCVAKHWNLSEALVEGHLETRTPGLLTGWIRLAGILGESQLEVEIEGVPVAIVGHGFVLAGDDPACSDPGLDGPLAGELEEFRWTVDTHSPHCAPPTEEDEESWLDLDRRWKPAEPDQAERTEFHTLYLKWRAPSGDTMELEALVKKVILLRIRRAG